jgi:hypothetical protein
MPRRAVGRRTSRPAATGSRHARCRFAGSTKLVTVPAPVDLRLSSLTSRFTFFSTALFQT